MTRILRLIFGRTSIFYVNGDSDPEVDFRTLLAPGYVPRQTFERGMGDGGVAASIIWTPKRGCF